MLRYISRRLAFIAIVCFLIIFAAQLGMRMVRNSESNSPDYNIVRHSKLAWSDTLGYLDKALQGNFGYIQESYGLVRVRTIVRESYTNSVGLLSGALALAIVLGLPLGALNTLTKERKVSFSVLVFTILGVATPSFVAGLLLRQGEMFYLRTFGHTLVSVAGFGWDLKHMLLPVLVLAARPLAYLTRASLVALQRIMQEDFIRTAFSKGLTRPYTVNIHALRNVAVPILTAIGVSLRFSLSSLPVVEFFFSWPGLGLRMLEAINARQTELVIMLALALGLTFLLVNLLLDILYRLIDPRVREVL